MWSTLFGVAIGAVVILGLGATGRLDGPALDPFPSAVVESVALLIGGGAIALALARLTR